MKEHDRKTSKRESKRKEDERETEKQTKLISNLFLQYIKECGKIKIANWKQFKNNVKTAAKNSLRQRVLQMSLRQFSGDNYRKKLHRKTGKVHEMSEFPACH